MITCVSTNKLLLESRDEGVGTKCQRIVCSFTALECLTIYEALEIDSCCIAVLCCTILNCDGSGVFLLLFLKLSLNFLVCYLCLRLRNLKSFIVTKSYLWLVATSAVKINGLPGSTCVTSILGWETISRSHSASALL